MEPAWKFFILVAPEWLRKRKNRHPTLLLSEFPRSADKTPPCHGPWKESRAVAVAMSSRKGRGGWLVVVRRGLRKKFGRMEGRKAGSFLSFFFLKRFGLSKLVDRLLDVISSLLVLMLLHYLTNVTLVSFFLKIEGLYQYWDYPNPSYYDWWTATSTHHL